MSCYGNGCGRAADARTARGCSCAASTSILNETPRVLELARAVLGRRHPRRAVSRKKRHRRRALARAARADARRAARCSSSTTTGAPRSSSTATASTSDPATTDSMHVAPVRAALTDRLIGLSCGTLAESLRRRMPPDADYLGVGAVFATAIEGRRRRADRHRSGCASSSRRRLVPVAAIGGITAAPASPRCAHCGVAMAAVISAIAGRREPLRAARELVACEAWETLIVLSIGTTHPWNVAGRRPRPRRRHASCDARVFTAVAAVSAQDARGVAARCTRSSGRRFARSSTRCRGTRRAPSASARCRTAGAVRAVVEPLRQRPGCRGRRPGLRRERAAASSRTPARAKHFATSSPRCRTSS